MKKLMMSIFIVTALASCSSENEIIDNGEIKGDERVEIKLNGGVSAITKAAVSSTFTNDLNVFFVRPDDGTEQTIGNVTSWGSTTEAKNLLYAKVSAGEGHPITFYAEEARTTEKKQYYDVDPTKYAYLVGYYVGNASDLTFANGAVSFTIDGTQDIMVTQTLAANKTSKFQAFEFQHKLSQLAFNIKTKAGTDLTEISTIYGEITKIEVLKQKGELILTLGATSALTAKDAVATKTFKIETTKALTANETSFGEPLMVYADNTVGTASNPIELKVFTTKFTQGIDATVTLTNAGLEDGKTHTIKLDFSKTEIAASASVKDWENSTNSGNGTVQ